MLDFFKKQLRGKRKGQKVASGPGKKQPLNVVNLKPLRPEPGSGSPQPELKRKILVVGKGHTFSAGVMDYAINLAARLDYDLIALNVNPALKASGKFFSPYFLRLRQKFTQQARAAWASIAEDLEFSGIHGQQVVKFGEVARAVEDLSAEIKRIDFVITDAGIKDEEITGEIPLPVFSITGYQGEKIMAPEPVSRKPWGKTIGFGAVTAALYAAVFLNGSSVMKYFTRGGWYAALPIATVFVISFVHGAFAHHLWSALGIEAVKRVQPRPEAKRPVPRKRPRPELRLNT